MDTDILLKNTSRSLYLSVQALPRAVRPAFSIAYLLCRYADTIADTHLLAQELRLSWIRQFPSLLEKQPPKLIEELTHQISGKSDNPYEEELIKNLPLCLEQFNQLSAEDQSIILQVVRAVCQGMEIDLSFFPTEKNSQPRAFQTFQELEHYCRLMGGKPGLFWSQLIAKTTSLSVPTSEFFSWGELIGDALQIVNILRDLPKDLLLGRCYFPLEDLQKVGLTPQDMLLPSNSVRFNPIKKKWIHWGLGRLQQAHAYFGQLSKWQPGQRAAVAWPILWTADTLYLLEKEPCLLNPAHRVKIPRSTIYFTLACTPFLCLSNTAFSLWLNHKIARFTTKNSEN